MARHPANNIIVSRIKGRLLGEDLAIFYRVLLETGLGEFERFDAPGGDETRSRDEAAAIKALDIGNSEKHEILGKKLNLIDVLPSALNNATIAFSMGNFAQAADAPAEEIAKACDDARNALQIGLCLYEAHKWIYGTEAFGLRLAAWVARKALDAVVDGLILLVMRLRKVPDAILPSGQIAEMAKEALAVWKVSKRLEWLWRHDPHYKQILDPKRIRAAFADHIMLKLWKEEVKAVGMRTIDAPFGYQKP